jgi:hypothetical protein
MVGMSDAVCYVLQSRPGPPCSRHCMLVCSRSGQHSHRWVQFLDF